MISMDLLTKGLESILNVLQTQQINQLISSIASTVSMYCGELSKSIRHIPSLYRHTNRPCPESHSPYVPKLLEPLKIFSNSVTTNALNDKTTTPPSLTTTTTTDGSIRLPQLSNDMLYTIQLRVFKNLSAQYYGLVQDLLISVAKTEASLQRFRKSGRRFATSNTGGGEDDEEIRLI